MKAKTLPAWQELTGWAVAVLATVLLLVMLLGCSAVERALEKLPIPPVELCYTSERYGTVCVRVTGKKIEALYRKDGGELDDEGRAEIEKALKGLEVQE